MRAFITSCVSCCSLLLASSMGCILYPPASLDAGLETGDGETGDGDGPTGGDGDGDGDDSTSTDTMGDGDGDGDGEPEPEPFACTTATALDGSPAPLPMSECTMICDESGFGGELLELDWSMEVGGEDAHCLGVMRDYGAGLPDLYTVDWRPNLPVRLQWFDVYNTLGDTIELEIEGELHDAIADTKGLLYLVGPDPEFANELHVWAVDPKLGTIEWNLGLLDVERPRIAYANDGFALLTHAIGGPSSSVWRFFHDIPEPIWTTSVAIDGPEDLALHAVGTLGVVSPTEVAFYDANGNLLDVFAQGVDKLQVRDLVFANESAFIEVADGPEPGLSTVDALLSGQALDGSFETHSFRWGDLDCGGELVSGDDRFNALAWLAIGNLVAVGDESYEFEPGEPTTFARIAEIAPLGELVGGVRLAVPNTSATSVRTVGDRIYVVIHDETRAAFDYQIRKYWSVVTW